MDTIVKFVCAIIVGVLIGSGLSFGLSSLYVIVPIILLILVPLCFYYNSKTKHKLDISTIIYGIIGILFIVFIIVGIGSCFHTDHPKDVRQQRIEMGLPMY